MNNKIKIVSVIALLLFAGSLAMPFISVHASRDICDMADWNQASDNYCDMDMSGDDCCKTMTECAVMPFQPIASAPLNKVTMEKNLTVDYNILFSENLIISEEHTLLEVVDKLCFSEVHPGFQTPLLV
jgi:hypothetical protein